MGCWGNFSSQSDNVLDHLHAKEIHHMTNEEVKNTLKKFMENYPAPWEWETTTLEIFQTYLGIVVHCVFQGRYVPKSSLGRALRIVRGFSDPELIEWDNPEEKLAALKEEQAAIVYALNHKYRGKVKYIKGLFDQLEDFVNGRERNSV